MMAKDPPPGSGSGDVPVNVLFLLDNSLSMRATDLKPNRLEKALEFASIFLNFEKEETHSLMVFSDSSNVLVPFTFDKEILRSNLEIIKDVNIFRGGSNLFLSIRKGISYLSKTSADKKPNGNILVLTDGDVHDYEEKVSIPIGVKIASVNFNSLLGSSVPSFDLDGNYKEPLLFKGKRVHSSINRKVFNKLKENFKNFNYWNWKPGILLEEEIVRFFGQGSPKNDFKNEKKEIFLTLWFVALGIMFLVFSYGLSRFKSFNKTFMTVFFIFLVPLFSSDLEAKLDLEKYLTLKVKKGVSLRKERLKLAEIYLKKNNLGLSKLLYDENLLDDYKKEDLSNLFNYGTLLLRLGLLNDSINLFDKVKSIYYKKKGFKDLEHKINSNILIAVKNIKKILKDKKNKINKGKKNTKLIKIDNIGLKKEKKFVNELSRPKSKRPILKDQLIIHVLSQDRVIQKKKLFINIYKNKGNWDYKGW